MHDMTWSRSRSIDNILCASNIPNWIYFLAFSLSLNLLKFTGWILIDVSEIQFYGMTEWKIYWSFIFFSLTLQWCWKCLKVYRNSYFTFDWHVWWLLNWNEIFCYKFVSVCEDLIGIFFMELENGNHAKLIVAIIFD